MARSTIRSVLYRTLLLLFFLAILPAEGWRLAHARALVPKNPAFGRPSTPALGRPIGQIDIAATTSDDGLGVGINSGCVGGNWIRTLFRGQDGSPIRRGGADRRERARLGRLPIASRTVSLGRVPLRRDEDGSGADPYDGEDLRVTVWEVEKASDLVQATWSSAAEAVRPFGRESRRTVDPYGVVVWPGSILASRELVRRRDEVKGRRVLVLGSGTGLEAQVAAVLGASEVIALDVNRLTLKLLRFGAERSGYGDVVDAREFDLFAEEEDLPECDVAVAADLVYNERLVRCVGRRCRELMMRQHPVGLIVAVSHLRGDYFAPLLEEINKIRGKTSELPLHSWEECSLGDVRGSGILGGGAEDQTYVDVKARLISI